MNAMTPAAIGFAGLLCFGAAAENGMAATGRIVVAHDDWILSDYGFSSPHDPGPFITNVASFFTGGGPGTLLAYSDNFGLTGSSVASAITAAGHSWTIQSTGTLSLAQMQNYDAVFLGGQLVPAASDLVSYVQGGGSVYVFGGGVFPQTVEPAAWNPFLNVFGLAFNNYYNNVHFTMPILNTSHPLFANVDYLYHDGGHGIVDLDPVDPNNQVIEMYGNDGVFAVYVPAPAGAGLVGIAAAFTGRRRREAASC